jgi:hypothetical protein
MSPALPVVLGPEEVVRLLDAAPGLKYKAALPRHYSSADRSGGGPRSGGIFPPLSSLLQGAGRYD